MPQTAQAKVLTGLCVPSPLDSEQRLACSRGHEGGLWGHVSLSLSLSHTQILSLPDSPCPPLSLSVQRVERSPFLSRVKRSRVRLWSEPSWLPRTVNYTRQTLHQEKRVRFKSHGTLDRTPENPPPTHGCLNQTGSVKETRQAAVEGKRGSPGLPPPNPDEARCQQRSCGGVLNDVSAIQPSRCEAGC